MAGLEPRSVFCASCFPMFRYLAQPIDAGVRHAGARVDSLDNSMAYKSRAPFLKELDQSLLLPQ